MRLWQKVFLLSLAAVLLAVGFVSVLILENDHKIQVELLREQGIREHTLAALSLQAALISERFNQGSGFLDESSMKIALNSVVPMLQNNNDGSDGLWLWEGGERMYSFGVNPPPLPGEFLPQEGKYATLLQDEVDSDTVSLIVFSGTTLENKNFILVTRRNVSTVFRAWDRQLRFFATTMIPVSALAALTLLGIVLALTRPLSRMEKFALKLSQGIYHERLMVYGHDELAVLAHTLNRMADSVEQNVRELEDIANDRKRFIDNFTHEMRTPLTSIVGFADLLRSARNIPSSTLVDYANTIYFEGQRLRTLSTKLMELIVVGKMTPELKPIVLEDFLKDIDHNLRPLLSQKKMRLEIKASSRQSLKVLGDAELLQSLLYNLVDNAVKASPEGSTLTIRASLNAAHQPSLYVTDQGCGMPREETRKVLQPFYMLDKARTRAHGGAGLGLALCAEIARVHDAHIDIQSAPGKGTTVSVTFSGEVA